MLRAGRVFLPPPLALFLICLFVGVSCIAISLKDLNSTISGTQNQPINHVYEAPRFAAFPTSDGAQGDEIVLRPLFSETRRSKIELPSPSPVEDVRQEPPIAKTQADSASSPPHVEILGLMRLSKSSRALIKVENDPERWVSEEESVEGWKIATIGNNFVVLVKEGQEVTISVSRH